MHTTKRNGYAVRIERKDGTGFLAYGGKGILPVVWPLSQRKYATEFKRELMQHLQGCRARVVRVTFEMPEVMS